MEIAKITSGGQITIPIDIRKKLGLKEGDKVIFLEEQAQIVAEIEFRLSVCDKLEQIIDENLNKSQALEQSILKKAFAGQLVPQDPNDEPAEELLKRIKQTESAKRNKTTREGQSNENWKRKRKTGI